MNPTARRAHYNKVVLHTALYDVVPNGKPVIGGVAILSRQSIVGQCCHHKQQQPEHQNMKVIAFAGIGYPQKFYHSLQKCGLTVANSYDFPDHHFYTKDELKALIKKGKKKNLPIYTTLKDFVKIPTDMQKNFNVLNIKAEFEHISKISEFFKDRHVF